MRFDTENNLQKWRPCLGLLLCVLLITVFFPFAQRSAAAQTDREMVIEKCERVQVILEDKGAQAMIERLASHACLSFARFRKIFGVDPGKIRIRVLGNMERWRDIAHRAWYIVSVIRDHEVLTQPSSSLLRLEHPERPVVHEIAHMFIRQVAGHGCPRWLDEGLAQWLSGDRQSIERMPERNEIWMLEKRLNAPDDTRRKRRKDYRLSLALVQRLIDKLGVEVLVSSLAAIAQARDPLSTMVRGRKLFNLMAESVDVPSQK